MKKIEFEVNINNSNGDAENIDSFDNITDAMNCFENTVLGGSEIELLKKVDGEPTPLSKLDLPELFSEGQSEWLIKICD